jgi:hypothetical protein
MFHPPMSEKQNDSADELDDEEVDEVLGDDDVDLDRVMRDFESGKKRAARKGEPAWRILEQRRERQETAAQISDFEDYDIDSVELPPQAAQP